MSLKFQCQGFKQDGYRCRNYALKGESYCRHHRRDSPPLCLRCHGSKTMKFTHRNSGTVTLLVCIDCDGKGYMTEDERKSYIFYANCWCKCSSDEDNGIIYHEDGEGSWETCVEKHHFHCGRCQKLTQIG